MRTEQLLAQDKAAYGRVDAPCPYFGTCGGCSLQDLAYEDQLSLKRERLRRAFEPLGVTIPIEVAGLEDPWRYRNKAELTFGESDGRLTLGYHAARRFWRVVDLDDCLLVPEPVTRVLRDVRELASRTGLSPYHPRTHRGFFRYLVVRASRATGQLLVCLITAPASASGQADGGAGARGIVDGMARELMARHPDIASCYWGVTGRVADVALPEELILLGGSAHLEDQVGPFRVRLAPLSFLQPTSVQAERIYAAICESLRETSGAVAWDLYCGIGLIALYLARHVNKVYGVDGEPHHLELAAVNAALNGIGNVEFRLGRVEALLAERRFWLQEAKPDVAVVDPPRAGLHPKAIASILAARPRQLVYLSCNVQTLIRDLGPFLSGFPRYRLTEVRAFDMFPQTHHLETLVRLAR